MTTTLTVVIPSWVFTLPEFGLVLLLGWFLGNWASATLWEKKITKQIRRVHQLDSQVRRLQGFVRESYRVCLPLRDRYWERKALQLLTERH